MTGKTDDEPKCSIVSGKAYGIFWMVRVMIELATMWLIGGVVAREAQVAMVAE